MDRPFCKNLRTKAMYVGATPAEALADKEGDDVTPCHFWCNLTQTPIGPDDRPDHKSTCDPSRPCFEE